MGNWGGKLDGYSGYYDVQSVDYRDLQRCMLPLILMGTIQGNSI